MVHCNYKLFATEVYGNSINLPHWTSKEYIWKEKVICVSLTARYKTVGKKLLLFIFSFEVPSAVPLWVLLGQGCVLQNIYIDVLTPRT